MVVHVYTVYLGTRRLQKSGGRGFQDQIWSLMSWHCVRPSSPKIKLNSIFINHSISVNNIITCLRCPSVSEK